jgi:xylan 1,4-beta-xylosidase
VWRHTDDQHQLDQQESTVEVTVRGLNAISYTVRHYRIDSAHSNAYTLWQRLGRPQDATDEQLAAIQERQGLEELEPARRTSPVNGSLTLQLHLPLPSVSLLVLEPA